MRQTATLSGGKVDWPTVAHAAQAVPQIAGGRKNWGHARLPKAHFQLTLARGERPSARLISRTHSGSFNSRSRAASDSRRSLDVHRQYEFQLTLARGERQLPALDDAGEA